MSSMRFARCCWTTSRSAPPGPVLDVAVRDGLVTLHGRVRTSAIKEIAELLVLRLPAVRAVRNDLIADPEVVRAVADAFAADAEVGPACPIVDARDGVVILFGDMPSEELARRAVEVATSVPLVASVIESPARGPARAGRVDERHCRGGHG